MEYKFKYITIPDDHEFDEDHLKFLQTLDEALVKGQEGVTMKEDLDAIKAEMEVKLTSRI